jgi:peptide/nickel transport system permease protein
MSSEMALISGGSTLRSPSSWRRLRLLLRSPMALASAILIVALVLIAIIGPMLIGGRANVQNLNLLLLPPFSMDHGFDFVLGADSLGRSMLLQMVMGARTSLLVAALSVGIAAIIGAIIGMYCGYYGGWLDTIVMRLSDVVLTLPSLMLALVVLYVLESSITNLVLVLVVTRLPIYMRVSRAQTLTARERVFVESARAIGSSSARIIRRDIRPLVTPTVLTLGMLEVSRVILAAAGLSFLGVGLQRPDVDLGMMVSDGRAYLSVAWWVTLFPGLVIVLVSLSANILSNWLRAIEDPSQSAMFIKPLRDLVRKRASAPKAPVPVTDLAEENPK